MRLAYPSIPPACAWAAWRTGVTTANQTFRPTSTGVYSFRSILRKVSTGAKSKPSPAKMATVS